MSYWRRYFTFLGIVILLINLDDQFTLYLPLPSSLLLYVCYLLIVVISCDVAFGELEFYLFHVTLFADPIVSCHSWFVEPTMQQNQLKRKQKRTHCNNENQNRKPLNRGSTIFPINIDKSSLNRYFIPNKNHNAQDNQRKTEQTHTDNQFNKQMIILISHTIIHPITMMIEFLRTSVTEPTMFSSVIHRSVTSVAHEFVLWQIWLLSQY